ncbi:MAG: XamI family restriction endonuclease [Anaerolineales bacterium]|nr:XamI family restriction endonuclease [Anaerolineales bacterium]
MAVNANKPERWKHDIAKSVDFYNDWFMHFAPKAYRDTRKETTERVLIAFNLTDNLQNLSASVLTQYPSLLQILRMATAPPIARDRLIGLAGVSPSLVRNMEQKNRLPTRMELTWVESQLDKIGHVISSLLDEEILSWLISDQRVKNEVVFRAATVIADRLCGAVSDPIIRNAQEQRQLSSIASWLNALGYKRLDAGSGVRFDEMPTGTYSFRMNVPVQQESGKRTVNVPIDAVVMPLAEGVRNLPLFIEAKSSGDFTNTNKRRKEEATKINQLKYTYGEDVRFILFLCGYFDSGYLGYEAAEGIDWVWEHRVDDLAKFGL